MAACVEESRPASLDYVITSILLPVFIAFSDDAKPRGRLMRVVIPIRASVLALSFLVLPSCFRVRFDYLYTSTCDDDVKRMA